MKYTFLRFVFDLSKQDIVGKVLKCKSQILMKMLVFTTTKVSLDW